MFKKLFNALVGNNEENAKAEEMNEMNHEMDTAETFDDEQEIEFDPETLHGTHYTVADFDAEVERRAEAWIAQERADGEEMNDKDVKNIYFNYRRDVYKEWNQCDSDQMIRFEHANSMKYMGMQTSGFVKVDENNPFLAPVHGITLKDYTAMCLKISSGVDYKEVCSAMQLEPVIWEELNTIWPQRMAEDKSFTVTTLFGQYYAENEAHPKLQNLEAPISAEGADNLEKMKIDRYFYEELCGARQAAYAYGLDGAQWILDNYGISLGDFQSVAMQHMTEQNKNWSSDSIGHYHNYQEEKQKEYAAKFAAEQGGNVADDVSF
jgi:hypothetical protein